MANVLTDLAPDFYKRADTIGRELVGFIPSATLNADGSERIELNGTVRSHFTREATEVDVTPSMAVPEGTDQAVDNKTLTLDKAKAIQIPWTGEDIKKVNRGSGFSTILGDQVEQAMRRLANLVEIDAATEAYQNASRAIGTAGTTPFGSNFDEVAQLEQILVDNGAPTSDNRSTLVINSLAGTNLKNLAQLQKANEAGGDQLLRQGMLLDLQNIMIKRSAKVQNHSAGTLTANVTVDGANAVGTTSIAISTDGTGAITVTAGDVVTFAGDTNEYVVASSLTLGNSASGTLVINGPGLRVATTGSEAVSLETTNFASNVCFHQRALEIAFRPPAVPEDGDIADDSMIIQDPFSGLLFEMRSYKGYRKQMVEVALAWGKKAWKPEFIALLKG